MKIKVYMGDWFLNIGIIGFMNILKKSKVFDQNVKVEENYIEFDSSFLENFSDYYFEYFIDEYRVSKKLEKTLNNYMSLISRKPDRIKDYSKKIKDSIKYQADKVKKFDSDNYKTLKQNMDLISKIKKYEEIDHLEKYIKESIDIFKLQHIDEKITLNLYKYVVGDNYFGQVSFFNVAKSSLDLDGLKKVMYNDYLLSIIYFGELVDAIEIGDLDTLKSIISEKVDFLKVEVANKNISKNSIKNIEKIYKDIQNKYIKKEKGIDQIRDYLNQLTNCKMCGNFSGIVSNYTESNFAPLAVSASNAQNLYWNMDTNFEICDICKLMLFCTPAGAVLTDKKYLTNEDTQFYTYINIETSIKDLYRKNELLRASRDKENPITEIIVDMVDENEQKSRWQLSNILFVEFKGSVDAKKSTLNYFDMPTYLMNFISSEAKSIKFINDIDLKSKVMDYLLKEKDLKTLIFHELKMYLSEEESGISKYKLKVKDILKVINIRVMLNYYKRGGKYKMEKEKLQKSLEEVKKSGIEIKKYYEEHNMSNKIVSHGYRLLNLIKAGNKNDFMDAFLRVFMGCEKNVPVGFLNIINEKDFDFESFGYAFVAGLLSEK